jgi:hypothetical protein
MSIAERMRFIQTYKTITTKESYKSRYEALILDHPKLAIHIHTKEQFFPWHRLMLRNVEKLLQEVSVVSLSYNAVFDTERCYLQKQSHCRIVSMAHGSFYRHFHPISLVFLS